MKKYLCLWLATASMLAHGEPQDQHVRPILQSENGRFVLGQISSMRSDQFLLDTKTGRLWQLAELGAGDKAGQPAARPVMFMTVEGKFSLEPK